MNWIENNGTLILTSEGTRQVLNAILIVVGMTIFFASLITFLVAKTIFGYSIGIFLIGMVSLIFIVSKGSHFEREFTFDPKREFIKFEFKPNYKLEFGYGLFKKFFLSEKITHSKNSRTISYPLFLIKKDGAEYWIDTFHSLEEAESKLNVLKNYILLPIETSSNIQKFQSSNLKEYSYETENLSFTKSSSLIEKFENGYTRISFKSFSFLSLLTIVVVLVLFSSLLVAVGFRVKESGSTFFFILFVPFSFLLITIFCFITLINLRNIQLSYNFHELKVQYSFFIFKFLDKEISIPVEEIKTVHVGFAQDNWFYFAIDLKNPIQIETGMKEMFYTLHSISNSLSSQVDVSSLSGKQTRIYLWSVNGGYIENFSDFYYLEQKLQKELRISEK